MTVRTLLRRWLRPIRPAEQHTAFVRACLPANKDGARDLDTWLALVGGPVALLAPRNPFKQNLPALAYAIEQRGEVAPPALRKVLGFTEIVEPMRAERYLAIVDRLSELMTAAALAGFLGGDAAAALYAYPKVEARHIAGLTIVTPAQSLPAVRALCESEGFRQARALDYRLELKAESGARALITDRLFPSDSGRLVEDLLAGQPGGLPLLPRHLLFIHSCIAGYPPIDARHAPAMIDAALLAPLLTPEDWRAVVSALSHARREPLLTALRYLRDALDVSIPLSV